MFERGKAYANFYLPSKVDKDLKEEEIKFHLLWGIKCVLCLALGSRRTHMGTHSMSMACLF